MTNIEIAEVLERIAAEFRRGASSSGTAPTPAKQKSERILLNKKELAERLSCSVRNVERMTRRRLIPHTKLGRLVRYDLPAVEAALKKLTTKEVT